MFRASIRTLVLASTSAAALLAAPQAFAAENQPAEPAAETRGQIETVVVTARKREESSQDVPTSLTTVRGDALTTLTSGGADMNAFSARMPSVAVESSFGRTFPRFYIRGLGNSDFDLNASQPVSLVYDEVVFENPVLKGFPVFDVERIEVLRGPQGTLFGRNTPAGIIKFDSVKPGQETNGYAKAGVRNLEGFDLEAAASVALSDTFALRGSLFYNRQGDYIENDGPLRTGDIGGFEDLAGRVQALWEPNEALSVLVNLHGRRFEGTSQPFRANVMTTGRRGLNANFKPDLVSYDGGAGNDQELTTYGATAKVEYDFGDVVLTSITGVEKVEFFGRGDIDGGVGAAFLPTGSRPGFIPFAAESADGVDDLTQFTQEIRLASDTGGAFSWQLGAYLFDEEVTISSYSYDTFGPGAPVNGLAFQTQDTQSWAVFAAGSWQVGEALTLNAGLRFTDDDKTLTARRLIGPFGSGTLFPAPVNVSDQALSWDLSAVYEADENVNFYVRAARGYRAPSIQGRIVFGNAITTADSEFSTSLEAGVKAYAFDRRVRADVSVYSYVSEDLQLTAIGGAGNFNQLLNAEEGLGKGFEVELLWLATDRLSLSAAFSYNDTEIDDAGLEVAPCGAPCTVLDPVRFVPGAFGPQALANIDGNGFPNAPRVIANLTAKYVIPLAGGAEIAFLTDWAYKGETNFFLYDSIEFTEKGFWEGGLRASLTLADGAYEVAAYARNILDEQKLVYAIDFNNLTGIVNAPRVFGLEAKAKF
jgi:iron complex outermembrane receptor protein